jgi:hypothetical protein
VGGPGNSLDRNYHYSTENYLNFIAERTSNTSMGFVNLFESNDKIWMGGRVRSMNLWLYRALMRHDMSHIGLTDTSSIAREDYIHTHGLHLKSRGNKTLSSPTLLLTVLLVVMHQVCYNTFQGVSFLI